MMQQMFVMFSCLICLNMRWMNAELLPIILDWERCSWDHQNDSAHMFIMFIVICYGWKRLKFGGIKLRLNRRHSVQMWHAYMYCGIDDFLCMAYAVYARIMLLLRCVRKKVYLFFYFHWFVNPYYAMPFHWYWLTPPPLPPTAQITYIFIQFLIDLIDIIHLNEAIAIQEFAIVAHTVFCLEYPIWFEYNDNLHRQNRTEFRHQRKIKYLLLHLVRVRESECVSLSRFTLQHTYVYSILVHIIIHTNEIQNIGASHSSLFLYIALGSIRRNIGLSHPLRILSSQFIWL